MGYLQNERSRSELSYWRTFFLTRRSVCELRGNHSCQKSLFLFLGSAGVLRINLDSFPTHSSALNIPVLMSWFKFSFRSDTTPRNLNCFPHLTSVSPIFITAGMNFLRTVTSEACASEQAYYKPRKETY